MRKHWNALAAREQALVLAAAAVVGVAVSWWTLLAPALKTLGEAPARHAELDAQLQRMHTLQAQAQRLKELPRVPPSDPAQQGRQKLEQQLAQQLTQQLGAAARLSLAADRATVTLENAPAQALARWLTQVRTTARALPVQARLTRSPSALQSPQSPVQWSGTVVLALPAP